MCVCVCVYMYVCVCALLQVHVQNLVILSIDLKEYTSYKCVIKQRFGLNERNKQ